MADYSEAGYTQPRSGLPDAEKIKQAGRELSRVGSRSRDFIEEDDVAVSERDPRGQLRQTIDELEGRIDILGNQLDHLFRAIDPILTPEQPRGVEGNTAEKAEIDRRSPMVKHLDRLIRNVKDLTDAVVVFEQRVDV